MPLIADVIRALTLLAGMVMIGQVIHLSKDTAIEHRFDRSRRYARWMIYLFAVTAIGTETGHWGAPPNFYTVVNVVAVVCGLLFVYESKTGKTSTLKA